MVAGGGNVIADPVHDVDDIGAFGKGTDGIALYGVSVIHKQDVLSRRLAMF